MNKLILSLFLCIFLFSIVSAAPPFQQDSATSGLDIAGIDFTSIKSNMARTAVACVFNDTNGVPISTGISCQFRVYEVANSGSLKFTNNTPSINGNCFNFGIPNNIYIQTGEYTRIIMCNSTTQGGFYKSTFYATSSGNELGGDNVIILFVLLFLIIIGGFTYVFINSLGHAVNLDFDIRDLAINIGMYFVLIATNYLGIIYLANAQIESLLTILISVGLWTNCVLPCIYFILTFTIGSWMKKRVKGVDY